MPSPSKDIAMQLIDRIYEAAFTPELWSSVIESLGEISLARSGSLLIMDGRSEPRWKATDLIEEALGAFVESGDWRTCAMAANAPSLLHQGFVLDTDVLTGEAIATDPAHLMQKSLGLGSQLACVLQMPTEEFIVWTLEHDLRAHRPDPETVRRLNELIGHLARSSLIAARLELQQAQTMVATLDRLGLPAAVLRPGGNVLAVNGQFEALDSLFIARAFGGVSVADRSANALLQTAVEETQKRDGAPFVASIPIAPQADQPPHVVHIVPLHRSARDIFTSANLLLVVNRIGASAGIPSNALVMALFDLSPAEARLALRLAAGLSLAAAGQDCGLSISSARTYLARIFSKTGTHSQHQLVALLRSAGSLGAASDTPGLG